MNTGPIRYGYGIRYAGKYGWEGRGYGVTNMGRYLN